MIMPSLFLLPLSLPPPLLQQFRLPGASGGVSSGHRGQRVKLLVEDDLILVEFLDLGVVVVIHLHLVAVVLEGIHQLAYVIPLGVWLLGHLLALLEDRIGLFLDWGVVFLFDLELFSPFLLFVFFLGWQIWLFGIDCWFNW